MIRYDKIVVAVSDANVDDYSNVHPETCLLSDPPGAVAHPQAIQDMIDIVNMMFMDSADQNEANIC
jgi:hypothetical protein